MKINLIVSIYMNSSSAIRIEHVGSCCTLIAEKILSTDFQLTEEMAYLLSGKGEERQIVFVKY